MGLCIMDFFCWGLLGEVFFDTVILADRAADRVEPLGLA